jgi:hypothetical protein
VLRGWGRRLRLSKVMLTAGDDVECSEEEALCRRLIGKTDAGRPTIGNYRPGIDPICSFPIRKP